MRACEGYFDSYGLFANMYANPGNYLNGTAPLNITGCIKSCIFQVNESTSGPSDCIIAEGTAQDSFLWQVSRASTSLLR